MFDDTTAMSASQSMPCPKCGKPMEDGFVPRGPAINWSPNPIGPGVVIEALTSISWWKAQQMHSHLCRDCKVLVLEYENLLSYKNTLDGVKVLDK